ncbi:MAG: antitoxin [Candidatus Competibacteraceae bacterium]
MTNITIRGIDEALDQALRTTAKKESRSVNQLVIKILKERFGLTKVTYHTRRHHDLDDLFGRWSAEEYERIQGAMDEQRKIDPELWL